MFLQTIFLVSLAVLTVVRLQTALAQSHPPNLLEEVLAKVESSIIESDQFVSCKQKQPNLNISKIAKGFTECSSEPAQRIIDLQWPENTGSGNGNELDQFQEFLLGQFSSSNSTRNRNLTRQEVALVRRSAKIGCEVAQKYWKCLQEPVFDYLREECVVNKDLELKSNEHFAVYLDAVCKNGGERLIDFYTSGGGACVGLYKNFRGEGCNVHRIMSCAEFLKTNRNATIKIRRLVPTFCELTWEIQTCLTIAVNICPLKEPTKALHSILEDVKSTWTNEHCLKGGASAVKAAVIGSNFSIILAAFLMFLSKFSTL